MLNETRDEPNGASEFCTPCWQIVFFNVFFYKKKSHLKTGNVIKLLVEIEFLLQCLSPPSALPGNLPMAHHLLIGSPLTQAGLWMEAGILIRPSSLLHHRQSWATYPPSLHQYCVSKQQNESHGKQPQSSQIAFICVKLIVEDRQTGAQ